MIGAKLDGLLLECQEFTNEKLTAVAIGTARSPHAKKV